MAAFKSLISPDLSCWYKRSEFGVRAAIFFSAAAFAGSFGGLLAAALAKMAGVGGKSGWAWIFIIEGVATVFVGIASYWLVHDFPDEAKFLNRDDRARVLRRLKDDKQASAEHEDFSMDYVYQSLRDWKTYAFAVIYMGADGALYAFSLFVPTIIRELGYSSTRANLLSVPPYAAAAVMTVGVGFYADRTGRRGLANMVVSCIGIIGFIMLISTSNPNVKYAGTFLGALGIYPCIANTISWASNNVEGVYKRGVTLGIVIGWGNLNGVVSSNIYRDPPRFFKGHGVVLGYLSVFLLAGSILTQMGLRRENALRTSGRRNHLVEGKTEKEIVRMGDIRSVEPHFTLVCCFSELTIQTQARLSLHSLIWKSRYFHCFALVSTPLIRVFKNIWECMYDFRNSKDHECDSRAKRTSVTSYVRTRYAGLQIHRAAVNALVLASNFSDLRSLQFLVTSRMLCTTIRRLCLLVISRVGGKYCARTASSAATFRPPLNR